MQGMTSDIARIRERMSQAGGRDYWRSLSELAEDPRFQELLEREFPAGAPEWGDSLSRRRFLQIMGASIALAGLTACGRQPEEKIYPYTESPEHIVPGRPLFYATAMPLGGAAQGLLVESHMGRPTKIEGNPRHPGSLGAADVFAQASILGLYDPDRAKVVRKRRAISTWERFSEEVREQAEKAKRANGAGLRILTEALSSPTLAAQLEAILREYPNAKWHRYEPLETGHALEGARLAFGEAVSAKYALERAEIIVCLESDFLAWGPGCLRHAREFAAKRRVRPGQGDMNRLYVVESTPSVTGSMADHRLSLPSSAVQDFALALAAGLDAGVKAGSPGTLPAEAARWIPALVRDLGRNRGKSLILAGESQPPLVHALAHAMNAALGNTGQSISYIEPVEARPAGGGGTLQELVQDMAAGKVEFLFIAGGNPVYDAPADIPFGEHLPKVKFSASLGLYEDETSALCLWHLPQSHYLEAWSDARAHDGTLSVIQPLIRPLYGGRSIHEVLDLMFGAERPGGKIVETHWRSQRPGDGFERWWKTTLHDGIAEGTAFQPKNVSLRKEFAETAPTRNPAEGLEIVFRPDPAIWDGRFANNGWLQELPKPLTKLTWDNAAMISPAAAGRLGVSSGDVVELSVGGRKLRAAAWVLPGQADGSVAIHLGYGRRRSGRVGRRRGFDAYRLRTSAAPWFAAGLELRKTGETYPLVSTQQHHSMNGRGIIREATREEYRKNPQSVHANTHGEGESPSLYPEFTYPGHAWGMAIDLSACLGCNACAVACQAENNIPIVGKDQVAMGREMNWLRVDTYYSKSLENPAFSHQVMLCMHCEAAPCEVVCPVAATMHSSEGLNEMIYNRCVGTRYCSNNCPYKVRRFNFLQYVDKETPSLKLMRNPDVTVRARGVMEKCTYCVQRIETSRIRAKLEDRRLRDGDIVTACQAACPTGAIVFGDINDPKSRVSRLKAEPRNYGLLAELNTRPRTSYLAKLTNPNPDLKEA